MNEHEAQVLRDRVMDNKTHTICPECGWRYHNALEFCPKCWQWKGKTDPFWICPHCDAEMHRSDRDAHISWCCKLCGEKMYVCEIESHWCDTKPEELQHTKTEDLQHTKPDDDITFKLARLLGDSQRVLREASKEITQLREL